MAQTWPLESECFTFYGDPRGRDAKANPKWEADNLVQIRAPYPLAYAGKPVVLIRVHRKCADATKAALVDAWSRVAGNLKKANDLGMTDYGGSYNYRLKRTNSQLSMHSFGCALDFDADRNPLGRRNAFFTLDHPLVQAFLAQGATWGGTFRSSPDAMHFQFARVK